MFSHAELVPTGSERSTASRVQRQLATEFARVRPNALGKAGRNEHAHDPTMPTNLTKGTAQTAYAVIEHPSGYPRLVRAIHDRRTGLFDSEIDNARPYVSQILPTDAGDGVARG